MVQINLRKGNYDKAIRLGVANISDWINKCAEKELGILESCSPSKEPCASDIAREMIIGDEKPKDVTQLSDYERHGDPLYIEGFNDAKKGAYRAIRKEDIKEGDLVQFVGYYILKVQEYGLPEPEIYFVQEEPTEEEVKQ